VMSGYWPRLYQLSIPDHKFETMAAGGMPSPFQQQGNFYTATVPLRPDLKWTDGTPFTADDAAFTINTVLSFQLGFDWFDFYNPDYIDHADAIDAHTVKFYFKRQPNVGVWQYGALQGPIVQKAYWSRKVSVSSALLPPDDLVSKIVSMKVQITDIQSKIDSLNAILATSYTFGPDYLQNTNDLKGLRDKLNQTNTALTKAQSQYDSAVDAARQSLYALDYQNEPTLGDWLPAGKENGAWLNKVNPAHPYTVPHFDRAAYDSYADESSAVNSIQQGEVNAILLQQGLSPASVNTELKAPVMSNPSLSAHFLIINPDESSLGDPIVRRALFCAIDVDALAKAIGASPLTSFVMKTNEGWFAPQSGVSCGNEPDTTPKQKAVALLKASNYRWVKEPSGQNPGEGLTPPDGAPFPRQHLLVLDQSFDFQAAETASQIRQAAQYLGLPVIVEASNPTEMRYTVFSSHQYDMALLGWRVSEYPGYLCDWFKDGNPFGYKSDRLKSGCEALNSTSDLPAAQKDVYEIQSILSQDLPFIPLYSGLTYDAYRNIKYPFDHVLNGLSGIYGSPSLAIPAP
jgi:peptide/nickel transport system substrate-binding protein